MKFISYKKTFVVLLIFLILIPVCIQVSFGAETAAEKVPQPAQVTQISSKDSISMAVKSDGSLWCWGGNMPAIGGKSEGIERPVKVMEGVKTAVSGYNCSMVIKKDGSLWMWGNNNPVGKNDDERKIPVKVMDKVKAAACGYHCMALKDDGSVWTWGSNNSGQLGDGTNKNKSTPVRVMTGVKAIAASYSHSLAVKTDGTLWAWGKNRYGQLGDGTRTGSIKPKRIMADVKEASAAEGYSIIIKKDNSVWGWGYDACCQLGNGSIEDGSEVPVKVMDNTASIALSGGHCLAVKTDGSLWTWGHNSKGELGDGTLVDKSKPVKIMDGVKAAAAEDYHSMALKEDGSLWAWGDNIGLELNADDFLNYFGSTLALDKYQYYSMTPTKIADGVKEAETGISSDLIITDGGILLGRGNFIPQPDGTYKNTPLFTYIMKDVRSVANGYTSCLAVKNDGSLWKWSEDFSTGTSVPEKIMESVRAAAVSSSGGVLAAIKEDGSLWIWGNNKYGQLGNGTAAGETDYRLKPVKIIQ